MTKVIGIMGARKSGKTTYAQHLKSELIAKSPDLDVRLYSFSWFYEDDDKYPRTRENPPHLIRLLEHQIDKAKPDIAIITDVTYLNEARWVYWNGELYCMFRKGIPYYNDEDGDEIVSEIFNLDYVAKNVIASEDRTYNILLV